MIDRLPLMAEGVAFQRPGMHFQVRQQRLRFSQHISFYSTLLGGLSAAPVGGVLNWRATYGSFVVFFSATPSVRARCSLARGAPSLRV